MTRGSLRGLAVVVLALAVNTPARAQTSTPSAVTTSDFRWLAGRWEGRLASSPNAVAEVTFSAPNARLIVGMMRLVQNDTVLVVELISLVDTPAGVEMRFRHFSPQLDVYEAQFKQAMRLKTHDAERSVFENTVAYDKALMSTQPRVSVFMRRGPDGYVARSDIMGSDGKPAVVEVTYQRAPTSR